MTQCVGGKCHGSNNNELFHECGFNEVVDVQIATVDWVTKWNESVLTSGSTTASQLRVEAGVRITLLRKTMFGSK